MKERGKRFRTFSLVWAGQLLSRLGSGMSGFAVGLHLYRESGSASTYSLLLLCAFLPSVLMAPMGGVAADRRDRRTMMILSDLGAALCVGFILLMLKLSAPHWTLYLGVAASSLFAAFHSPAFKAAITDMVDPADYSRAGGLVQLAEATRHVISPAVAGCLLSITGLEHILALDMLTFLCAALCAVIVKFERAPSSDRDDAETFLAAIAAILPQMRKNLMYARLLKVAFATTFFVGVVQTLFAPMVLGYADEKALGMVLSVGALGMIASSLFIGAKPRSYDQRGALGAALSVAALCCVLMGLAKGVAFITTVTLLFFASLPFINTALEVVLREGTSMHMQGRMWSAVSVASQSGMLLAFSVSGFISDKIAGPLLQGTIVLPETLGMLYGRGADGGPALVTTAAGAIFLIFAIRFVKSERGTPETKLT